MAKGAGRREYSGRGLSQRTKSDAPGREPLPDPDVEPDLAPRDAISNHDVIS